MPLLRFSSAFAGTRKSSPRFESVAYTSPFGRHRRVVHEPALAGREAPDQAAARQRVHEDPVGQAAGHDQPVARGVDPVGEQAPVLARARGRPSASRARACLGTPCRRWWRSRRTGPCPAARSRPRGRSRHPGGCTPWAGRSPREPRRARRAGPAAGRVSRRRAYPASASGRRYPQSRMDERALTERLVTYDTSTLEGMQSAAGFVKGWLEARDVEVTGEMHNGRPVLAATVGPAGVPTVVFHGHLDVVPASPELFDAAHRRRSPLRARRLRHEGRARGDDVRPARRGRPGRRARALPLRVRRGVGGDGRAARLHPPGPAGLHRRLRDHRRAHRPPHRRPGQGRARAAHRGGRAPRRTAPPPGSATTRWSRRSTCSARSSRCRSRASRPTSSTGRRSTSAASPAATPSTACRTRA